MTCCPGASGSGRETAAALRKSTTMNAKPATAPLRRPVADRVDRAVDRDRADMATVLDASGWGGVAAAPKGSRNRGTEGSGGHRGGLDGPRPGVGRAVAHGPVGQDQQSQRDDREHLLPAGAE